MAIYAYKCPECGEFEKNLPMPGLSSVPCPNCGRSAKRQISLANFTFGWRLSDESHIPGNTDKLVRDI